MKRPEQDKQMQDNNIIDHSLLAELRKLFISTKKLSTESVSGGYKSAFKGRGIEFEELREYQAGDDVRAIDWKVTARTGKPFIKSFREERDLTVVLAIDLSKSTITGSSDGLKDRLIAKVSAAISFIALQNRDKVGILTFAGDVISFTPPKRTKAVVWKALHDCLEEKEKETRTSISKACRYMMKALKSNTVIFIVSDFCDDNFSEALGALSRKHDVTAVYISDKSDLEIPKIGLLNVINPETGKIQTLDLSDNKVLEKYKVSSKQSRVKLKNSFEKAQVKALEINTSDSIAKRLAEFFNTKSSTKKTRQSIEV